MDKDFKQAILSEINSDRVTIDKLLQYDESGDITFEEMKDAGLKRAIQEEFIQLKNKRIKEAEERRIREEGERRKKEEKEQFLKKLSNSSDDDSILDEIKVKLKEGIVSNFEISQIIGVEELDRILKPSSTTVQVNFEEWSDLPDLPEGRTDIYILGTVGSGKSCLLAGLFYYAKQHGRLAIDTESDNHIGTRYKDLLVQAVKRGQLPPATSAKFLNYVSIGLKNDAQQIHPVSLVEMGGEKFNDTYESGSTSSEGTIGARGYLKNDNKKVIFFVIDYGFAENSNTSSDVDQGDQLEAALKKLSQDGTLDKTDALFLIVTKADKMPKELIGNGTSQELVEGSRQYIQTKHLNLKNNIKAMAKKHDFKALTLPFTLGKFSRGKSYLYDDTTSALIFDKLTTYTRLEKRKDWIEKIFGGRK